MAVKLICENLTRTRSTFTSSRHGAGILTIHGQECGTKTSNHPYVKQGHKSIENNKDMKQRRMVKITNGETGHRSQK